MEKQKRELWFPLSVLHDRAEGLLSIGEVLLFAAGMVMTHDDSAIGQYAADFLGGHYEH